MSLTDLYQQVIMDHYRRPRNQGEIDAPEIALELSNPVCGDVIEVQARVEGERLADIRFHGKGCSISQASASMMTELLRGRELPEALALIGRFKGMMRGEGGSYKDLGELQALTGVSKYPVRIKCATLAWNAAERGIEEYRGGVRDA